MVRTILSFEKNGFLKWQWPLKVGVFNQDKKIVRQLREGYWPKKLSSIHQIDDENRETNLLFFPGGFEKTLKYSADNHQFFPVTDILLIKEDAGFFCQDPNDNEFLEKLDKLIYAYDAFGICIYESDLPLSHWYESFIEHLAHNRSIPELIESLSNQYILYIEPRVHDETKLIHIINGIIHGLQGLNPKESIRLSEPFMGRKKFNTGELASILDHEKTYLNYANESGASANILNITKALYKLYDPRIFLYHSDQVHTAGPMDDLSSEELAGSESQKEHTQETENKQPRYVQSKFRETGAPETKVDAFKTSSSYQVSVRIGYPDENWIQAGQRFQEEDIFTEGKEEETIDLLFMTNQSKEPQESLLKLGRAGNSELRIFHFDTGDKEMEFLAELWVFHKNRLLQLISYKADIVDPAKLPAVEKKITKEEKCIRTLQYDLDARTTFASSFIVDSTLIADGALLHKSSKKAVNISDLKALHKWTEGIKNDIEYAVEHIEDFPEDLEAEENVHLLRKLAMKGSILFVNLLQSNQDMIGPVQIVSGESGYLPLDFIYTYPAPDVDAGLCEHAREALKSGQCKQCIDQNEHPADRVCPFGFWGFSQVIERHRPRNISSAENNESGFKLFFEPAKDRKTIRVLQTAVHGSTLKVDAFQTGLRDMLKKNLQEHTKQLLSTDDWKSWREIMKENDPDSIVLLVHTEKNIDYDVDQMEIGDGKFLLQSHINSKIISGKNTDTPPFVILIGCSTSDLENGGFDLSNHFLNIGAAVVLSNFTKIRGRQAGPIVMKLIEYLKNDAATAKPLGEITLKLKQNLLAEGIMVSLALVAHGDADWQLKS